MDGIEYGEITQREKDLLFYLGNSIADWVATHTTDRGELICAFTILAALIFSKQTPITDVEKQCAEVDAFCKCIKLRIRNG